jgi:RNA polymerase sigma-70 factor (ECF subfamily)
MTRDLKIINQIYLLQASSGNAEAFGKVFDNLGKSVYRFILFKVSFRHEVAEDLSSQAFLKVWEAVTAENAKRIKNLVAFLYQVARNLVIDYYRKQGTEELPLLYDLPEESLSTEVNTEVLPSEVEKMLSQLNSESREIIWLKYVEGLSVKEICEVVQKSSGAIRVIIHRAKKELKAKIGS